MHFTHFITKTSSKGRKQTLLLLISSKSLLQYDIKSSEAIATQLFFSQLMAFDKKITLFCSDFASIFIIPPSLIDSSSQTQLCS